MSDIIINLIMPIIVIGMVIFITDKKTLSWSKDIGLVLPSKRYTVLWLLGFIILIFLEEYFSALLGVEAAKTWVNKYSQFEILLKTFGIVLLSPIAEELLFRGLLYSRILSSPLKLTGAVLVPALIFSFIHIQYSSMITFLIIFIDGIYLALARYYSGSVVLAIILHSSANFYAVLERI